MPTKSDIEAELRRIGDALSAPCEFTHFGGCNMAIQGIKDSTKDVDVVMQPPEAFGTLVQDLSRTYAWVTQNEVKEQFQAPRFQGVLTDWERLEGPLSLDLFPPGRIFNVLTFTPALLKRRHLHFSAGRLRVFLADPTTTFLLKSITGRWHQEPGRDLEDLQSILDRRPVHWAFLANEWQRQMASCPNPTRAAELAIEAMAALRKAGYTVPWNPSPPPSTEAA